MEPENAPLVARKHTSKSAMLGFHGKFWGCNLGKFTIPETNSSPLKINGWKMKFPSGMASPGYLLVSFQKPRLYHHFMVGANHPQLVVTLCSLFSRENGHPGGS